MFRRVFTYLFFFFSCFFFYSGPLSAQFTFQRTFQAPGMNGGLALSITSDSGYVVTGQHGSSGEGMCDFYVYKRNACGGTDFFFTYGDTNSQGGKSIMQTADGGFIVWGLTQPHAAPTSTVIIQENVMMKLDAGGNMQWLKDFGNGISDWPMYIQQTSDGGFIATGSTVNPNPYTWDMFLLKTDAAGVTQWSKVFVAPGEEFSNYVEQTTDGGFFMCGYSWSTVHAGDDDVVAIKTDGAGNAQWSNVYGGTKRDGNTRCDGLSLFGTRGKQTSDGGYAIATSTRSFGVNDSADVWLLKLNAAGNVQWNKTYGGVLNEEARGLYITHDNGFAIIAWTTSFGFGEQDEYLLKTDSQGNLQWSKTYGGTAREKGESIMESPIDHGYYIDGYSMSFTPNPATDVFDAYAIKTDSMGVSGCNETTPPTIVGSGTPVKTPFPFTLTTLPTRTPPVFIQHAYNPGEYPLCEKLPPPPVAQFNAPPLCVGNTTIFTDSSKSYYGAIVDWIWDFGDGTTADSIQNPVHTYSAAGTYTVTLIIHTPCTADTVLKPVVVNPLPVPLFSAPPVCFNNVTTFNDQSTGNNTITIWDWNFGDLSAHSSSQTPTHTYTAPGTYTATLILTNNFGCKDTSQSLVIVNPLPIASFLSTTVCFGDTTCFNDKSTISTGAVIAWSWNFNDPNSGTSNISNIANPCHVFTGLGPYNVLLTVTSDSGCQSTVTLPVNVIPPPVAVINTNNVCLNSMTNYTDASTAASGDPISGWNWSLPSGTPATSTNQNPSTLYPAPGTYTATLIVTSQAGCKDTTTKQTIVHAPPVANFSGSGAGCAPLCVTNFTDSSTCTDGTITNWAWSFPGGTPSAATGQVPPKICYDTPGIYDASLIVTSSNGCTDTVSISPVINVYDWPNAGFCIVPDHQAPVTEPVFNFCDQWSQDVVQWSWDFGDNSPLDSISTNPAHSYSATANANDFYSYDVCIRVMNQHGCWDTICKTVDLLPEFEFYIPNTFTPNHDGKNEFFFGKCRGVKEYEIWVFDRWGNELWNCHYSGKNTDWDGQGQDGLSSFCKWDGVVVRGGQDMNGNSNMFAQEDVYVWKVELTDIFKKKHNYIGHVNIVR